MNLKKNIDTTNNDESPSDGEGEKNQFYIPATVGYATVITPNEYKTELQFFIQQEQKV